MGDALDQITDLEREVEKLRAFKAYVHERLDKMGVPADPPGEHRDAGCRVGQRLDVLEDHLKKGIETMDKITRDLKTIHASMKRITESTDALAEVTTPMKH